VGSRLTFREYFNVAVPLNDLKEDFSKAYIRAVGAVARCTTENPVSDYDSVDLTIRRPGSHGAVYTTPQVDVQAKCTASPRLEDSYLVFDLPVKNYRELRDPAVLVKKILVVMVVPVEIKDWLDHSESKLLLFRGAYWMSLYDLPPTSNRVSRTIRIPRAQLFDVEALTSIMDRVSDGAYP
jgi:Domain of unknown function (DUF4365)